MKQLQLLFLFLAISSTAFSSSSTINGKIDPLIPSNQKFVRLLYFKDYISNEIETLDFDILNEKNEFELNVDLQKIQYCFIEYDFKIFGIYLEPEKSYTLELKLIQTEHPEKPKTSYIELYIESPVTGLNHEISNFNMIFEDFMMKNMKNSYGKINKSAVADFKKEYLSEGKQDYYSEYKKYKIASLEQLARIQSSTHLADNYFVGKKILYNNIEYMEFFKSFFSEFIVTNRSLFSQDEVVKAINNSVDFTAIDKMVSEVSYLQELQVRELVLLLNLKEMFYISSFNQNQVLKFIKQISQQSNSDQNKKIATNILTHLKNPSQGKKAPEITLKNFSGEEINLSSFAGKATYLAFIRPGNSRDQSELDILKTIFQDFSDEVNFVCIAINGNQEDIKDYIHYNEYPFTFLIMDGNIDILDKFNIYKAPQFIILDKNLIVKSSPSLSPSEELAGYLNSKLKD